MGNDVTLAEFELKYDQDLRWLEVTDCPYTGCVPNASACACDYTSKDPAVCGQTPVGCPPCNPDVRAPAALRAHNDAVLQHHAC